MPITIRNPPAPVGITPMQVQVLSFLRLYLDRNECSPTLQEIADGTGRSRRSIEKSVDGLERRNRISRVRGLARSIQLLA